MLDALKHTLVIALLALLAVPAAASPPDDAVELRQRMESWIAFFDSPAYAGEVTWDEHVILLHRLVEERWPEAADLHLARARRDDLHLTRSEMASLVLRSSAPATTWGDVRRFVGRAERSDFVAGPEVRRRAAELAGVSRSSLREAGEGRRGERPGERRPGPAWRPAEAEPAVAGEEFLTLYGFIHAHSELSDGEGSANEAYSHARDVGGLDYFALTDHGELLIIWPWQDKWEELKDAADGHDEPGAFTALWGFEWSNPILGHVNVVGSADYTDSVFTFELEDLYGWIAARRAFARFNHPGRYDDLFLEFHHLDYDPTAAPRMVGIETFNKGGGFGDFHYDCEWLSCAGTYLDEGNGKGWFLGALGGQDNHSREWGDRNDFRVAVLARSHDRGGVMEAYARRRFYATEDSDLDLDVRVAGFPMGSRLAGVARVIEVEACDGSGDDFVEARLYRNGSVIATEPLSGSCPAVSFDDSGRTGSDYYYVVVTQADDGDGDGRGDEAIASPIWIEDGG